jgi:hypothetical protein
MLKYATTDTCRRRLIGEHFSDPAVRCVVREGHLVREAFSHGGRVRVR